MRQRVMASLLACGGLTAAWAGPAQAAPIAFEEYRLPNGLTVLFHEDHSAPMAVVNVNYHVGSKNDPPGRTGFAHLFEHVMFEGSKGAPKNFFHYVAPIGAKNNAYTSQDRTNYYEILPSNQLELGLFLEADRMGTLVDVLDRRKLDNQRDVVKNEKRFRYDNKPYGSKFARLEALNYKVHPYGWTPIGSMEHLDAASLDDVKAFFKKYYVPNNATLVVAGDFDPAQAKTWVTKYFGPLKQGGEIVRPSSFEPPLTQSVEATVYDNVQFPGIFRVYRAAKATDRDAYPLELLTTILGTGESSRLHQKLVRELKVAQSVEVFNWTKEDAGELHIHVIATPGKTTEDVEKALDAEIAKVRNELVSGRELQKAKNSLEAQRRFSLETIQARADQLADYSANFGDPDLINREQGRYDAQTRADLIRVARQYLKPDQRIVLRYVPQAANAPAPAPVTTKPEAPKK